MLVGVLADTHGVFDPALTTHLSGVHHILHAGDVGSHGGAAAVLSRLRRLAPTTAVSGNVDANDPAVAAGELPPTALLSLAGWLVLVVHILGSTEAAEAVERHQPDVVIHGHSHKYCVETVEGGAGGAGAAATVGAEEDGAADEGQRCQRRLHLNPGSAGPARFRLGRSLALLSLPEKGGDGGWVGEMRWLTGGRQAARGIPRYVVCHPAIRSCAPLSVLMQADSPLSQPDGCAVVFLQAAAAGPA